jgi:hypothetical protein
MSWSLDLFVRLKIFFKNFFQKSIAKPKRVHIFAPRNWDNGLLVVGFKMLKRWVKPGGFTDYIRQVLWSIEK